MKQLTWTKQRLLWTNKDIGVANIVGISASLNYRFTLDIEWDKTNPKTEYVISINGCGFSNLSRPTLTQAKAVAVRTAVEMIKELYATVMDLE